jgi:membrane protease YdiL (CAAX protease family)
MSKIKSFIRKYPVVTYFILTFVLSWGCMVLMIGPGSFPITAEQSEAQGALLYVGMLIGPSVAGILLTGLVDGKAGFRRLMDRLRAWRVGARWYAAALLTAPLIALAVLLLLSLSSPAFVPALFTADDKLGLLLSGVMAGLMVGVFEELGWTGFAIPRLRSRYGIFSTGLIVGLVWGAWHFLPFWEGNTFSGALPLALLLARLFAWLPPYRILMVWVYDRTDSLLVAMLMHGSLVATTLVLPSMELNGVPLMTWLLAWAVALWIVAGVVHLSRYELGNERQNGKRARIGFAEREKAG